jgi:hypothetical protein
VLVARDLADTDDGDVNGCHGEPPGRDSP